MTTVIVVDTAEAQLREIVEWWSSHRPKAPWLVLDEFERCVAFLESSPDAGVGFARTVVRGVRRLLLKRTRHFVYYVHDERREVVYVIAVWGAPKVGDPQLHDPR